MCATCSSLIGQMLDDPHFTPPESPLMTAYDDGGKFSNVSWCAHYLQVLGSEKPHAFKVRTPTCTPAARLHACVAAKRCYNVTCTCRELKRIPVTNSVLLISRLMH